MMDVGRHPNINLITISELIKLEGKPGNFKVKVLKHPRYVDLNKCTACGDCSKVCPIVKPNEFELGLGVRKAIFKPFPQAVPSAYVRNADECLGTMPIACAKCLEACKLDCINFDEEKEILDLTVGSVIVAAGLDYYDPREASEYGYTRFENVVTSFELERLLSAGGPARGEFMRFTDRKPPKTIAFINCVGSRNTRWDINYCSRICCMNSIKDSLIIREFFPDAEIYIFYIDIRAFGKGFEELYNRSLEERVKYIKGKPSKITEEPKTGNLILSFENQATGKIEKMKVDMAVLSSAIIPSEQTKELATILGVETDNDGFFKQKDPCSAPLDSTQEGIYLCGCATGPKDITDSIAEASAAAAKAALLVKDRVKEVKEEVQPLAVTGGPRIGVFVCHCGLNIAGVLPCVSLAGYASGLKDVVFSEDVLFACAESTQRQIQERIKEHGLNRVVVAACTPKTHEPVFQESLAKIGLNPYLFEMVNIRDQCSWVHQKEPEAALAKAQDLIRMGVARSKILKPLQQRELTVGKDVLVIGGGIAGIQTAVDLARQGLRVYLVEKEKELGGRVRNLVALYPSAEMGRQLVERKIEELAKAGVEVITDAVLEDIRGFVGNFEVKLKSRTLNVGAIVLAIGSDLFSPKNRYSYGKFPNVVTNMEMEFAICNSQFAIPHSVAFIQCVGSREKENPGCSRYCCQAAIKQAVMLKEKGVDVTIFNRGIRVYTKGAERMYRKARELGVLFIPFDDDKPPQVLGKETAESVEVESRDLKMNLSVPVDMVILSAGMRPKLKDSSQLAEFLKVPKGSDQFFLERHPKFGPVETSVEGVFLCGCCQFPRDIGDTIAQAGAVAAKVSALLGKGRITLEPITSTIEEVLCRGCGDCVQVCEFKAIELTENASGALVARVNEALCKGCGTCAAVCPTGACDLHHFTEEQIEAELKALLVESMEVK